MRLCCQNRCGDITDSHCETEAKHESMKTIDSITWQEDAISWLQHNASELPASPALQDKTRPSLLACGRALELVRRHLPAASAPIDIDVTGERGIQFEWIEDRKSLMVEVREDGWIEIIKFVEGITTTDIALSSPDWRIGEAIAWLKQPVAEVRSFRFAGMRQ